jgi:hypothetical protein
LGYWAVHFNLIVFGDFYIFTDFLFHILFGHFSFFLLFAWILFELF